MAVYKDELDDKLTNIDFHLINKCNLNCVSCGHFCPLVKNEKPQSFDNIKGQLERVAELTDGGNKLQTLTLTGGEITLHPDLYKIVELASNLFTNEIRVWSNGMLWERLATLKPILQSHSNMRLFITDYKQPFTKKADEELNKIMPDLFFVEKQNIDEDVYFNWQFLDKDEVAHNNEIRKCIPRQYCNQLVDYRLYACQYLAYFKYFNDTFEHKIPWAPELGSIDIRDVNDIYEIKTFMKQFNCEFCKHCKDCKKDREVVKWRRSDRDINEWYKGS